MPKPHIPCGKICLSEREANAFVLANGMGYYTGNIHHKYFCHRCTAWHTTSQTSPPKHIGK